MSKNTKITIATGIFPPDIGGPATYSKLMLDELPKRGISVNVLSFGEVRHLPKVVRHFAYVFKLLKRSKGRDLIFAQDPVSVGLPALVTARLSGKKLFVRVAGDYAWEQSCQRFGVADSIDDFQKKKYGFKVRSLRAIQAFVVRHADRVITPSKYFRDLVSGWNKGKIRITHIYNGIEFPPKLPSRSEARREMGIGEDSFVIVSAGRLVPWKGFPALIDCVKKLQAESAPELYILGDGPEKGRLQEKIKGLGLESKAHMTGSVSREKMFAYLCAADVFILNTAFESFSFQIVEAMYAGVPVVSTNIGNIPEIIENGTEGILITPDNLSQMSEAVNRLKRDERFRREITEKARKKSLEFSIQSTVSKLCEVISEPNRHG